MLIKENKWHKDLLLITNIIQDLQGATTNRTNRKLPWK